MILAALLGLVDGFGEAHGFLLSAQLPLLRLQLPALLRYAWMPAPALLSCVKSVRHSLSRIDAQTWFLND